MNIRIATLIIYIFIGVLNSYSQSEDIKDKVLIINKDWTFCETGKSEHYKATVPGTIHSDLINNGLIENPFYGKNENNIKWIEEKDWIYSTKFNVSRNDIENFHNAFIVFDGLDTFAKVYLNGKHIMTADNMFVSWEKDVRNLLNDGENSLEIHFTSPLKAVDEIYKKTGINYPADNDRSEHHLSVYARKAPYHYGWDWGIRMVGCGIWRPVKLVFNNGYGIEDIYTYTSEIKHDKAFLETEMSVTNRYENTLKNCKLTATFQLNGKTVSQDIETITVKPGSNIVKFNTEISNPQLWQPNGWGKQNLYDVEIKLAKGNEILACKSYRTGIRTIRFVSENDSIGRNFMFEVNGKNMFAKGTNYIPQDIILTNVSKKDYRKLFEDVKNANMNMIRIWGGGIYEDDYFYQLADENGILVWQDFMFACSTYPGDSTFLENINKEAIYNIKRLRNHPSLALWCGNNEIYEGIKYWGWNRRYEKDIYEKMKADYDNIFRNILDKAVKKYDHQRSYIHTSPDTANWGRPATQGYGDIHYWGIWYGKEMFDAMDTLNLRFVSEYGFESFPEMKTILTFASEKDLSINSDVMVHRQKSSIGNELIETYMQNYYRMPDSFDDFLYLGLILQGHGISYGIETNRRQRPVCMGSLYWQLNDSWPAISWSAIDYYKNKKALYYHSRDAFAPLILSAQQKDSTIDLYAISDLLEPVENAEVIISIEDFKGKTVNSKTFVCNIGANTNTFVASFETDNLLAGHNKTDVLMNMQILNSKKEKVFEGIKYLALPKELNLTAPKIEKEVRYDGNQIQITLTTDVLAKDIFIEIPAQGADFTDNFFDLRAGETKNVTITGKNISEKDIKNIRIRTLTDTY